MLVTALAVAEPVVGWLQGSEPFFVHSSFQKVLNLRGDKGQLVTLLSQDRDDGPFSIRLPLASFSTLSDMQFHSDETLLRGSTLTIQWSEAPRWNPELLAGWLTVDQTVERLVSQVLDCLAMSDGPLTQSFFSLFPSLPQNSRRLSGRAEDRLWQLAGEAKLAALHRAVTQPHRVPLSGAAQPLLGWGAGLTPAGDDCLLGLLAGQRMLGHDTTALQAMIHREVAARTTSLSAALLRAASTGHFSASWHRLALALQRREAAAVENAARHLMAQGASSGADALVGWLLALLPKTSILS